MEGIEKLWWAKRQLEEQTEGKQRLITRTGGHLFVKVDDSCLAACYFAMVRNQKTGTVSCGRKGLSADVQRILQWNTAGAAVVGDKRAVGACEGTGGRTA